MLYLDSLLIATLGMFMPHFSIQLNTDRLYHIIQLILAPFCIIGCLYVIKVFAITKKIGLLIRNPIKIVAIFLSIFFIFNSGLIYQLSGEITPTASLISLNSNLDYAKYNDMEVASASWFFEYSGSVIWGINIDLYYLQALILIYFRIFHPTNSLITFLFI